MLFRDFYARLKAHGVVSRRLERLPCGLASFEITDPDVQTLRLTQPIGPDERDLPTPVV